MNEPIAYISVPNLLHNARYWTETVDGNIIFVVKADAYGHGLDVIVKEISNFVDNPHFAVARLSEAKRVRAILPKCSILLLSPITDYSELLSCIDLDIDIVISTDITVVLLSKYISLFGDINIYIWLKLNSGMNRFGFDFDTFMKHYNYFCIKCNLKGKIRLISHLACSSEPNDKYTSMQIEKFNFCREKTNIPTSLLASAGSYLNTESNYDYARIGLSLYGVSPFDNCVGTDINVMPVMELTANLIAINFVRKGELLGYNNSWQCSGDTYIGIVCIGYGDGYPRSIKNGVVNIGDSTFPLVGSVNMDTITVNLGMGSKLKVGTSVTLWGNQYLPIETIALASNRIPYELLTGVSKRVRRIYK
jgi:alanine racemase